MLKSYDISYLVEYISFIYHVEMIDASIAVKHDMLLFYHFSNNLD